MSRIRMLEPNVVFNVSTRTVDRCFLLSPNHHADMPLLHRDCPREAFDSRNDIVPVPSTINIVGSAVGRAMEKAPINLHAFESNSNHIHQLVSANEENLENIVTFERNANSLIARGMNKILKREGHFFGGRYRAEACVDDKSAEQKLFYALTNVVKDGLVEKVSQSPFFSTFKHQANGEPLRYWYIDYEGYWAAGGDSNPKIRPKDFIKWVKVETTPLPAWEHMPEHRQQSRIRQGVREIEKTVAEERKRDDRKVMGVPALFERDPRSRAEKPNDSGPQPLCHSSTKEGYYAYREKYREFRDAFIKASWDFRNGFWERQFLTGSFRPPLIRLCNNDEL